MVLGFRLLGLHLQLQSCVFQLRARILVSLSLVFTTLLDDVNIEVLYLSVFRIQQLLAVIRLELVSLLHSIPGDGQLQLGYGVQVHLGRYLLYLCHLGGLFIAAATHTGQTHYQQHADNGSGNQQLLVGQGRRTAALLGPCTILRFP